MKGENMSHEEIWDDSALQNSWEDALAEYKKYHSLAAKGEEVDLAELDIDEQDESVAKPATETQELTPINDTSNATIEQPHTTTGAQSAQRSTVIESSTSDTPAVTSNPPAVGGAIPQALLNSVRDEGMKNLMMSWYYAGYYTGLLEGQQKAFSSMQQGG